MIIVGYGLISFFYAVDKASLVLPTAYGGSSRELYRTLMATGYGGGF